MIFFSILCALLIDHFRPMRNGNLFFRSMRAVATHVRNWCDTGLIHHARMGWATVVAFFVFPVLAIYWICLSIHPFFGLLWNILILYLCMGFRHYNHYFTAIQMALLNGENSQARNLLSEWCGCRMEEAEDGEITHLVIEKSLVTVLKDVFGVIFWFVLPFGPAGAVFYRVSACLQTYWQEKKEKGDDFGMFAEKMFYWINWLPVRLAAVSFAMVGNFENAIYGWKNFSGYWKNRNVGVLLASAGGAMGVRLGMVANEKNVSHGVLSVNVSGAGQDLPPGEEPAIRFLQSTLGLIWRTLLLWLIVLFLFTMAFYLA
ncbi:CobD/CbiB family protein [Oxalobacter paraformigenes]|uniref:Cobalamin biosynthesis protein CobD n=1 Tax=Oxalobacter paraformigenes TaxID=556268 RepID=C3X502_9BURK|nr:CobD/CbiB family protein [Oxalobacter paraformigenes]EEO28288.1 hypothetical protein OFAG_01441 [Oxalobacter paraformigenes]